MTNDSDSNKPANESEQHSPLKPEGSASAPKQGKVGTQTEKRADEQPTVAQEMRREFRWFEFGSLFINGALAIIGVIALCIYGGQLKEMRKATEATKTFFLIEQRPYIVVDENNPRFVNIPPFAEESRHGQRISQEYREDSRYPVARSATFFPTSTKTQF